MTGLWDETRSGSHAGRGFHYQDAIATELALRGWSGQLPIRQVVPEGVDDVSLELDAHWLHIQVKSRREHRGEFGLSDLSGVWPALAKRLSADPDAHVALVVEQPLAGIDTGLDQTLGDVPHGAVHDAIAKTLDGTPIGPDEFFGRSHLIVMAGLPATAIDFLAAKLDCPPATCSAHHAILRRRLAELADENGVRTADDPASLSTGEIARLLDDVSEAVDPTALEEAVLSGACELVDFSTSRSGDGFYSGVDVTVGHVVAGLPAPRPSETGKIVAGLRTRGSALVVGPSGAGKSALIWMTAYATRHEIAWYRVRRLTATDVTALVRLIKGLRPTDARPVGFVVDDLGDADRDGFDAFVDEAAEHPGTLVLGACREEDLALVEVAHRSAQIRPALDEALAERLWRELQDRGETDWAEWREPYETASGLLLEYGHLLTEGHRLRETIAGQIDRRIRDGRDAELAVLAPVALANAFGASVQVTALVEALDLLAPEMKAALTRLVDEHMITERSGVLSGLHEIRSQEISRALHLVPPPTLVDTVRQVVSILDPAALRPFLTRLLLSEMIDDSDILDAAANRIAAEANPETLAGVLYALRVVVFRRVAARWRDILNDEDVPPTNAATATHLALRGGDLGIFPEGTQRAVARMRDSSFDSADLRAVFLELIGSDAVSSAIAQAQDVETAAAVLAALGETGFDVNLSASGLGALAQDAPLPETRLLLDTAYVVSPALSIAIAQEAGGEQALLDRLEQEMPWIRNAHQDIDADGRPIACADYVYVAESEQPDGHEAVVELARHVRALAPSSEVSRCRAIDATGELAGIGDAPIADKSIPRDGLPSPAEVAWNRACSRAVLSAVAAETDTEHLVAAREVIRRAARLVRRASDRWVRGKSVDKKLLAEMTELNDSARSLKPAPIPAEATGPLEDGDLPAMDPVSFAGEMVAGNLLIRLFQQENVAPFIDQLLEQVDKFSSPEYWHLLTERPVDDAADLKRALLDLQVVVAERSGGGKAAGLALDAASRNGFAATAKAARELSKRRSDRMTTRLHEYLANAGFDSTVTWPAGIRASGDGPVALVESESVFSWSALLEEIVPVCRTALGDQSGFTIAPVREGKVVASHAAKVYSGVYLTEELRTATDLPLPVLDEHLGDAFRQGLQAAQEASGIVATLRTEGAHDVETDALEAVVGRAQDAQRSIAATVAEQPGETLETVQDCLLGLASRVDGEIDARDRQDPSRDTVAASFLAGLRGTPDDLFEQCIGTVALCAEYDVNPQESWNVLEAALESAEDH